MARRKQEVALQVRVLSMKHTFFFEFLTYLDYLFQQEVETNEQWEDMLKKEGLIGIILCFLCSNPID